MPASSKKNTRKTNEDRPPNRNVKKQSVGVLETNQNDQEFEKEYQKCKEELEKVDGKEKKLDQVINDAIIEKCRFCVKTGTFFISIRQKKID